jgi:hypothetical protein
MRANHAAGGHPWLIALLPAVVLLGVNICGKGRSTGPSSPSNGLRLPNKRNASRKIRQGEGQSAALYLDVRIKWGAAFLHQNEPVVIQAIGAESAIRYWLSGL